MEQAYAFRGDESREQLVALTGSDNRANRRRATTRLNATDKAAESATQTTRRGSRGTGRSRS